MSDTVFRKPGVDMGGQAVEGARGVNHEDLVLRFRISQVGRRVRGHQNDEDPKEGEFHRASAIRIRPLLSILY